MTDYAISSNGYTIKITRDPIYFSTNCVLGLPNKHWIWTTAPDKDPRDDPLSLYYPGYPETASERYNHGWVFSDAPYKIEKWDIYHHEITWQINSYNIEIIYDTYMKMIKWLNDPINGYRHESILFYREPNKRAKRHALAASKAAKLYE
jgi:hypothetical protein